jgi:methyl-accepting chemotaxis protein
MATNKENASPGGKKQFKMGVQWKISLVVVTVVAVFIAFILGYILPQMEKSLYDAKKVETQDMVKSAWTTLGYYQEMEKSGALTKEEAQKQAKAAISALRYGEDMTDYFFIIDFRPYIIAHGVNSALVNTDVSQYKDANGDFMFQSMVQIAKSQKEGFTSYMWQYKTDAKRIVPKTSYIKTFEPWGWIVGTGIYTVDVEETISGARTQLTIISLIIMLLSIAFCAWLIRVMISKPLDSLVAVGKAVAAGDVDQDVKVKSGDEVGQVTQAFADVVAYLKEMSSAADKISQGDLSIEVTPKSEKDALSKSFAGMAVTLRSLISEIDKLTRNMTEGKLSARADAAMFKGDYAGIVQGINDTLTGVINPLNMAAEYVDRIASGNTPDKITDEYKGDFNTIKNNLNKCIDAIHILVDQTGIVIGAAREGKLDVRAEADKADGVYRKILKGFNEALDFVVMPLREAQGVLNREADYDLTTHVNGDYKGDLDNLKNAINASLDNRISVVFKLKQVAKDLTESSSQLTQASEQAGQATQQIATSSQQVAKGAADQATALQETMKAMEQLSRAIDQIAKGAQEQAQMIEKNVQVVSQISTAITDVSSGAQKAAVGARVASESAQKGAGMTRETVKGMESIKRTMDVVSGKVNGLGDRSKEIGKIVSAIDDIADQTNLLALNAAVEAARAGEQGRGFAVVADEVRKLAERSSVATKEIADLIGGIQGGVADTISAMEKGTKEVEGGYELANKAGQALDEILEHAKEVGMQVEQISSAAEELTAMSTEMVKLTDNISAIVEENTAATEEMAATAKQVSKSVEGVAGVAEENSAATEQVSAAAEEISAQVEEVVASGGTLSQMGLEFEKLVAKYKLSESEKGNGNGNGHGNGNGSGKVAASKEAATVGGRISNN